MFHAWEAKGSSLLNVLMPDGFPIAPRWIPPTPTASLTATECLKASDSAEHVSVLLTRCHVVFSPGTRGVRWGGRGDELRLRGVVIRSPGTDQTLATGGGRLSSVPRHRSRVVWHSPDEGHFFSIFPPRRQPADWLGAPSVRWRVRRASRLVDGKAGKQRKGAPQFHQLRCPERRFGHCGIPSQA